MTLISTLPKWEGLNNDFVALLKSARSTTPSISAQTDQSTEEGITSSLQQSKVLTVSSFYVIPGDRVFLSPRYVIAFKLNQEFAKHFILLRGLFEFSRPGSIKIISKGRDKTFEGVISHAEVDFFLSYVNTVVDTLKKEIRFKIALREVLSFEESVRKQQEQLYLNIHHSLV